MSRWYLEREGLSEVGQADRLEDGHDPLLALLELTRDVVTIEDLHVHAGIGRAPVLQVVVSADEAHPLAVLRRLDGRRLHGLGAEDEQHVGPPGDGLVESLQMRRLKGELNRLHVDLHAEFEVVADALDRAVI